RRRGDGAAPAVPPRAPGDRRRGPVRPGRAARPGSRAAATRPGRAADRAGPRPGRVGRGAVAPPRGRPDGVMATGEDPRRLVVWTIVAVGVAVVLLWVLYQIRD